jgi:hypothetical protein
MEYPSINRSQILRTVSYVANNAFYPRYSEVSAITNALQAIVTFTEDHDFTIGEIVAFRVGKAFGMPEINNKHAKVLFKTDSTITINIDTSTWGIFTLSQLNQPGTSPPVCLPSASGVIPFQEDSSVNIEDSFD